ncbi:MAG: hypothetical protein K0S36_2072 [Nitrosospira multiformis]|jgi:hypothetical protein|nr:hypothetical protein [Nitrosospira multiformis]
MPHANPANLVKGNDKQRCKSFRALSHVQLNEHQANLVQFLLGKGTTIDLQGEIHDEFGILHAPSERSIVIAGVGNA